MGTGFKGQLFHQSFPGGSLQALDGKRFHGEQQWSASVLYSVSAFWAQSPLGWPGALSVPPSPDVPCSLSLA